MRRAVPIIEITNDSDELGVGSPHGEVGSVDTVDGHDVGTEFFVEASVGALGEEIEVLFGEASYVMTNRMDHEAIVVDVEAFAKGESTSERRFGSRVRRRCHRIVFPSIVEGNGRLVWF